MKRFNCHIHTNVSPDCFADPHSMAHAAVSAGFDGISITDHCSGSHYISFNSYDLAKNMVNTAKMLQKDFSGKLEVLKGIEFEEMFWSPDYAQRLIDSFDFDIVLASVHKVSKCPTRKYFSRIDFSKFSNADLLTYVGWYFDDVLETVTKCDFDALAHLTIIERYIRVKYRLSFSFEPFLTKIDEILKVLIARGKALEVNTSESPNIGLMPNAAILKRYKDLGGKLVTIGTDAHKPEQVSIGFDLAVKTLKDCGFKYYVYYKNRKPVKEIL